MIVNTSLSEALQLYGRGMISRGNLERELVRWDERKRAPASPRFWRAETIDLEQDRSGAWTVPGRPN